MFASQSSCSPRGCKQACRKSQEGQEVAKVFSFGGRQRQVANAGRLCTVARMGRHCLVASTGRPCHKDEVQVANTGRHVQPGCTMSSSMRA
eukprot:1145051-Pelagomonas_calceolata.AAC.3